MVEKCNKHDVTINTCYYTDADNGGWASDDREIYLCVESDGYANVDVNMSIYRVFGNPADHYPWKMRLQRWNDALNHYETIGTREGYVASDSHSYRQFTNVKVTAEMMRVEVGFSDCEGGFTQDTIHSEIFLHE